MFRLIIILSSVAVALDLAAWQRIYRRWRRGGWLLALCLLDDMLPLAAVAAQVLLPDNTRGVVLALMWIMLLYAITVIPRAIYLVFTLWSRRRIWRVAGSAAAAAAILTAIYGTFVTRTDYRVVGVAVESPDLPPAFDGYGIAMISDLHVGSMLRPAAECRRIVETVNSLDADLVAFCGDLVNVRYDELTGELIGILGSIRARDGVVSVTGNHDTGIYISDRASLPAAENLSRVVAAEREMGWLPLEDTTVWIVRGADSIAVSGISFREQWHDARHSRHIPDVDPTGIYENVDRQAFDITLSHVPQLWETLLATYKVDLTLSGHVHAMQCKLPSGGRGLSPAQAIYPRWSGLYREGFSSLYINDGIGCVGVPTRIGACPEITFLRLEYSSK